MRADFHTHSRYSDGAYSPKEVCVRAARAGLKAIAITDHDTLAGEEEKRAAASAAGLLFVSGWEISAWEGGRVHILGYHSKKNGAYAGYVQRHEAEMRERVSDMLAVLNPIFHTGITVSDVERMIPFAQTPLHTMFAARAFKKVSGKSSEEIYALYFASDKRKKVWVSPTPEEAVRLIRETGGVAVLAHPGRIELEFGARERLMEKLVSLGLNGIECYYPAHTLKETEYFLHFQREHGLFATGGSDFHSDEYYAPVGFPAFDAPASLLEILKSS